MELLVKKAQRGDAEAFIELIAGNKQSMYKVARGFLNNDEDVADAMSETESAEQILDELDGYICLR